MLGSAVSSSTPKDFQPSSHMGVLGSRPLMNRHAWLAPPDWAWFAVGMHRALDSGIGLPRRSTSALWMLVFLMPADVRRSFMMPLLADLVRAERLLQRELQDRQRFPIRKEKIPFSSEILSLLRLPP